MNQKIMLIGYGRAGKGSFCQLAKREFGISSIASSLAACQLFLFEQMKAEFGYHSIEQCYEDRHNHRQYWYEAIRDFNTPNKGALGDHIFANYNIYDGCRDKEEFDVLKERGAFDLCIWVDAGDRVPPEPITSMTVTKADADIIIENNGGEQVYLSKVQRLLETLL